MSIPSERQTNDNFLTGRQENVDTSRDEKSISMRKLVFDEQLQKWVLKSSTCPTAIEDDIGQQLRFALESADFQPLRHDSSTVDPNNQLAFTYCQPMSDVRKVYPDAQFYLNLAYEEKKASEEGATLNISFNNSVVAQLPIVSNQSTFKGVKLDQVMADSGTIVFKICKGTSMLQVHSVELMVILLGRQASHHATGNNTINAKQLIENHTGAKQVLDLAAAHLKSASPLEESNEAQAQAQKFNSQDDMALSFKKSSSTLKISAHGESKSLLEGEIDYIMKAHDANDLVENLDSMESLKTYQEFVEFKIPLNKLYELVAASLHTEGTNFCALLLCITDAKTKSFNQNKAYLLQVWKRGGQMLFEKSLSKPVYNWNMNNDIFLFQTSEQSPVHLVCLYNDEQPQVIKFKLPLDDIRNGRLGNSTRVEIQPSEEMKIQDDSNLDDNSLGESQKISSQNNDPLNPLVFENDLDQTALQLQLGDKKCAKKIHKSKDSQSESVYQIFEDKIFRDKIMRFEPEKMIDEVDGFVMLAFHDPEILLYFDANKYIQSCVDQEKGKQQKQISIERDDLRIIKVKDGKKIIRFPELNAMQSCLVIEDIETHQVSFLGFKLLQDHDGKKKLNLRALSIKESMYTEQQKSPILKFCSSASYSAELDEWSQVSLLLRQDGRVEIYTDFIMVDEIYDHKRQCVDIESGNRCFYFKMVQDSHKVDEQAAQFSDLDFRYLSIFKHWKNRIGPSTISVDSTLDAWSEVLHERVAPFVKLYSSMTNFMTFMIVAHRNLLSLYDLGLKDNWVDTIQVLDSQDHIRNVQIKKRPRKFWQSNFWGIGSKDKSEKKMRRNAKIKDAVNMFKKFELACLIGTQTLAYIAIDDGIFKRKSTRESTPDVFKLDLQTRVLHLIDDQSHAYGMALLTDDGSNDDDFHSQLDCLLYNFPLDRSKVIGHTNKLKLQCVKMRRLHLLLSSDEPEAEGLLTHDCSYGIRLANRDHFTLSKQASMRGMVDEIKKISSNDQKIIKSLSLSLNGKTKIFPLSKKRSKAMEIKNIYIIKSAQHTKTLALQQDEELNESQLLIAEQEVVDKTPVEVVLEAFYMTNKDFAEDQNTYFRINHNRISIFDPDGQLKMIYRGFKFQNVTSIQQLFLYASSDANYGFIVLEDPQGEQIDKFQIAQVEGLYVYDVTALLECRIEPYKVSQQGMGGQCTLIEYNSCRGRLSFMEDYYTIVVIPIPQLNIINFLGMTSMHDYLIWREKKGFFTALNYKGELNTWSILTGKLLYQLEQHSEASKSNMRDYQVYRGDQNDFTYTRNNYNLDDCSISLLRTNKPINYYVNKKQSSLYRSLGNKGINKLMNSKSQGVANFDGMSFARCGDIFELGADCQLVKDSVEFELFHFKVMQLRTYEDNKDVNECSVRFHFTHRLIKMADDDDEYEKQEEKKVSLERRQSSVPLNAKQRAEIVNSAEKDHKKNGPRDGHIPLLKKNKDYHTVKQSEVPEIKSIQQDESEWAFNEDSVQRLYLSKDTTLMMEVIKNRFAIIYKRHNVKIKGKKSNEAKSNDYGQLVDWRVMYHITRWPSMLQQATSVPYLFSPNFTYMLDFDYQNKMIKILRTCDQSVYITLPVDMINTKWQGLQEKDALIMIFSRIKWEQDDSERRLRILAQNDLDCIFEIFGGENGKKIDANNKAYLKLISVCKVDNLHTDTIKINSPHYYLDPFYLPPNYVIDRLIRMNQSYKTEMQHAINLGLYKNDMDFKTYMLEHIQKVNYLQQWGGIDAFFTIENSFTWLDWMIIDQAIRDSRFKMKNVSDQRKLQLALNIFPNGNNILHILARERNAKMVHINKIAMQLFELSKTESQMFLFNVDWPVKMEIPFLSDINKRTALDICLNVWPEQNNSTASGSKTNCLRRMCCKPDLYEQKISRNFMLADIFLQNIMVYGLLHSSTTVTDALIEGIRLGLPAVKSFLESRIIAAQHPLLALSYPKLNTKYLRACSAIDGDYGYVEASIWGRTSQITGQLFPKQGPKHPTSFQVIDLPELHQQSKRGLEFITALTECKDWDIFKLKSVQIIIDHHYYFWYHINLYTVVFPAIAQVILFWFWHNFVLTVRMRWLLLEVLDLAEGQNRLLKPKTKGKNSDTTEHGDEQEDMGGNQANLEQEKDEWNFGELNDVMKTILFILTLYLLLYDFTVLISSIAQCRRGENKSIGLVFGVLGIFLHLLVIVSVAMADDEALVSNEFWRNQSWVAFAIWFRMIVAYLGEIQQFSWLVGLIKFSCSSSFYFLTVFLIAVTAVADCFTAIEQKMQLNGQNYRRMLGETFEDSYELRRLDASEDDKKLDFMANFNEWMLVWQNAFRTSIGDFNSYQLNYFGFIDWLIFFLLTFFLGMVMLNLLIAVIAGAQHMYMEARVQTACREKALQIRQKGNSLLWPFIQKKGDPTSFMYIVQQISTKEQDNDPFQASCNSDQVEELQQTVEETQKMVQQLINAQQEAQKDIEGSPKLPEKQIYSGFLPRIQTQ